MSDMLINDPLPSFFEDLRAREAAVESAKQGLCEARDILQDAEKLHQATKDAILAYMQETGEWQVEDDYYKISLRKTQSRVEIDDEDAIDPKFFELGERKLNKKELKKALEASSILGIELAGAHLSEPGQTISISPKLGRA